MLIPVIGLAFYFMLFNMPPTLEGDKKDMKHHRRGDFARSWVHGGKEEMQRKIREAQAKLERDEKKKKN